MREDFDCLNLSIDGDVAHIRFTRPELHNCFDESLHGEFPRALKQMEKLPNIAALILSADGKSFSAGGDLEMILRANLSPSLRDRLRQEGQDIIDGLLALPCPVIAAVQGAAIGLGASVIACSDIVVAWRGAKIADPHVVLGLVAGDGGVMGWSQSVGIMRAKRYLLTGDRITAEQAYAMGLVSDLVDKPEDTLVLAEEIAVRIAALPRGGVRGTKQAFAKLSRDLYHPAFLWSLACEMESLASDEVRNVVTKAQKPT